MFANLLLSAVAGVITSALKLLLDKFQENNGPDKAVQLKSTIKNAFLLLKDVTDKTKTKIDDTIVDVILEAVKD